MTTEPDDHDRAGLAVLEMALQEELTGIGPEAGERVRPERAAPLPPPPSMPRPSRGLAAASLFFLGIAVVVAVAVVPRRDSTLADRPMQHDVDLRGPATLEELQRRAATASRATAHSLGTWSDELGEVVTWWRFVGLDDLFRPSMSPSIDDDEFAAIVTALAGATVTARADAEGADVAWTEQIAGGSKDDRFRVLLARHPQRAARIAFATPRGAVEIDAPAFPFAQLAPTLDATARATIEKLGIVIGAKGFAAVPSTATNLRLIQVPASAAVELTNYPRLRSLELWRSPDWHRADVLDSLRRSPLEELFVRSDLLDSDGIRTIASLHGLKELKLGRVELPYDGQPPVLAQERAAALDDDALLAVSRLPNLARLSLCAGSFTDRGLAFLAGVPSLHDLTVFGCDRVTGDGLRAFAGRPLTKVNLYDCERLETSWLGVIADLPKLRELGLSGSAPIELRDLPASTILRRIDLGATTPASELHHLRRCAKLERVTLRRIPVGDADLAALHALRDWRELRWLFVSPDAFTDAELEPLRAVLPHADILHR